MQCPPEIAAILCDILTTGLLRIRALGGGERVFSEADHLHNLPALLSNYKPELLDFYWRVERTCYLERIAPEEVTGFERLWNSLAKHVHSTKNETLTSVKGGRR
jgi:hypothetical protein